MPLQKPKLELLPVEFENGNCRELGIDTSIMYPEVGDKDGEAIAKSVCSNCVVVDLCLDRAIRDREQGVWGGKTQSERVTIRRKRYRNNHGR